MSCEMEPNLNSKVFIYMLGKAVDIQGYQHSRPRPGRACPAPPAPPPPANPGCRAPGGAQTTPTDSAERRCGPARTVPSLSPGGMPRPGHWAGARGPGPKLCGRGGSGRRRSQVLAGIRYYLTPSGTRASRISGSESAAGPGRNRLHTGGVPAAPRRSAAAPAGRRAGGTGVLSDSEFARRRRL